MAYWDASRIETYPPEQRDFAQVWQSAEKIVFSRSGRNFDAEEIRELKRTSTSDITVGGAELAALALEAGLVDECHLFVGPVVVGGGKPAFRSGSARRFDLLGTHRFDTGVVHLHYRIK
ncbi:MAG: dihydrofolate reductase family protein [Candidatus Eremiobacteraeota bacterium]|nr:dihydrofolate reductase family protein [Candidatus Eremiobacteraeota bacterium]